MASINQHSLISCSGEIPGCPFALSATELSTRIRRIARILNQNFGAGRNKQFIIRELPGLCTGKIRPFAEQPGADRAGQRSLHAVLAPEFINAASSIENFLLAGVERMAR
jgi:hypothetical protein